MIEICAVGGYNEVGKNMTAIKIDNEVIIFDMGVYLDSYIRFTKDEIIRNLDPNVLMRAGAIPDISAIDDWKSKVVAIIPSHAHLDHVGALPFLANRFDAPIMCTPFTAEVIKAIIRDEKIRFRNEIKVLNPNSFINLTPNIKVEFVNMTHSTPQTAMVVLHTKYGAVIYGNDFKLDNSPVLGKKPDYDRLREIGKKGVLAIIMDSTYSREFKKTPSEAVAKEMLREVMLGTESQGKLVVVTTFASHMARLKSIIEFGKEMKRKIVFMGRSLSKYTLAAEAAKIVDFSKKVEITRYSKEATRKLKEIEKHGRQKYLLVVTGHQGEPDSMLYRMTFGKLPFKFNKEDIVIFSSHTIPTEINKLNVERIESELKHQGVRMFTDIHSSGHAMREDMRDLISMFKPKKIIPAHGFEIMKENLRDLALEIGYTDENIIMLSDGERAIL